MTRIVICFIFSLLIVITFLSVGCPPTNFGDENTPINNGGTSTASANDFLPGAEVLVMDIGDVPLVAVDYTNTSTETAYINSMSFEMLWEDPTAQTWWTGTTHTINLYKNGSPTVLGTLSSDTQYNNLLLSPPLQIAANETVTLILEAIITDSSFFNSTNYYVRVTAFALIVDWPSLSTTNTVNIDKQGPRILIKKTSSGGSLVSTLSAVTMTTSSTSTTTVNAGYHEAMRLTLNNPNTVDTNDVRLTFIELDMTIVESAVTNWINLGNWHIEVYKDNTLPANVVETNSVVYKHSALYLFFDTPVDIAENSSVTLIFMIEMTGAGSNDSVQLTVRNLTVHEGIANNTGELVNTSGAPVSGNILQVQ